jgi:hypothetical protein
VASLVSVRTLDLAGATRAHLSAASGLVRIGRWFYVVADDELALGVFDIDGVAPGHLLRLLDGDLPRDAGARKAAKPDFEVLLGLPPDPGWPYGALLALGSGSRPNRERGVLLMLDAAGAVRGPPREIDAAPLFAALRASWPTLNLEGAAVQGETLWFAARASRDEPRNALLALPYAPLREHLRHRERPLIVPMPHCRVLALGHVAGIAFGLTDLVALPQGRFAFCAVTEDSRDSYDDGPCHAAAVGVLAPDGAIEQFTRVYPPFKIEGLDVRVERDGLHCWLVSDADDPDQAAHLLSLRLPFTAR